MENELCLEWIKENQKKISKRKLVEHQISVDGRNKWMSLVWVMSSIGTNECKVSFPSFKIFNFKI